MKNKCSLILVILSFILQLLIRIQLMNYIYPTSLKEKKDEETYLKNNAFVYQSHGDFDKTVAVTSIVDDGNRYFERDDEIEDSSFKATDRGTLVHLFLELFPLEKNLNFEEAFEKHFNVTFLMKMQKSY